MKHVICTALVILGLIFQPFAAARSDSFAGGNADSVRMTNQTIASVEAPATKGHSMDMGADQMSMPCSQVERSDSSMVDCDDCCNQGCAMMSECTNTASVSLAVLQYPHTLPKLDLVLLKRRAMQLRAATYASFIYHPPQNISI